ncbi:hypothetical protein ACA910_012831 [Epithemia clementina (nom. ined.)]
MSDLIDLTNDDNDDDNLFGDDEEVIGAELRVDVIDLADSDVDEGDLDRFKEMSERLFQPSNLQLQRHPKRLGEVSRCKRKRKGKSAEDALASKPPTAQGNRHLQVRGDASSLRKKGQSNNKLQPLQVLRDYSTSQDKAGNQYNNATNSQHTTEKPYMSQSRTCPSNASQGQSDNKLQHLKALRNSSSSQQTVRSHHYNVTDSKNPNEQPNLSQSRTCYSKKSHGQSESELHGRKRNFQGDLTDDANNSTTTISRNISRNDDMTSSLDSHQYKTDSASSVKPKGESPSILLHAWFNRPPLCIGICKSNYISWTNTRARRNWHTSIFVDPRNGECFRSVPFDGVAYFQMFDQCHWFPSETLAENAAASCALDLLKYRETHGHTASCSNDDRFGYPERFVPPPRIPQKALQNIFRAIDKATLRESAHSDAPLEHPEHSRSRVAPPEYTRASPVVAVNSNVGYGDCRNDHGSQTDHGHRKGERRRGRKRKTLQHQNEKALSEGELDSSHYAARKAADGKHVLFTASSYGNLSHYHQVDDRLERRSHSRETRGLWSDQHQRVNVQNMTTAQHAGTQNERLRQQRVPEGEWDLPLFQFCACEPGSSAAMQGRIPRNPSSMISSRANSNSMISSRASPFYGDDRFSRGFIRESSSYCNSRPESELSNQTRRGGNRDFHQAVMRAPGADVTRDTFSSRVTRTSAVPASFHRNNDRQVLVHCNSSSSKVHESSPGSPGCTVDLTDEKASEQSTVLNVEERLYNGIMAKDPFASVAKNSEHSRDSTSEDSMWGSDDHTSVKELPLSSSRENFAHGVQLPFSAGSSASGVDEILSAEKTENSTGNSSTHNRLAGSIPKGASSSACSVGSTSSFDSMWGYNDQVPSGSATEMLPARSECQENARIQACLSVAAIEASDDTGIQEEQGRSKQKHPAKNNFDPPEDCKMSSVKDVCSTAARVEFKKPPLSSSRRNFAHGDTAGSSASGVDEILSAEKTENSTSNSSTHNRLAGSIPKGASSPACSVGSTSSFDSMWGYNDQLPSGNATEMLPARSECQENARIQACLIVAAIEASDDTSMQAEQGRSKQKHPAKNNFDPPEDCKMSSVKDVCSTAARVEFKGPPLSSSKGNLGHSDAAGSSASGVDKILSAEKIENSTGNSSTHNRLAGSIPKGASSPACSVGSTSSFDSMWGYNDQLPPGNATEMLPARSECQENTRIQACLSVAAIEASDDTGMQAEQGRSKQKHPAKNNFDPPEDCKMSSVKDVCSTAARVEFKEPPLSSSRRNFAHGNTAGSSASGVDEILSAEKTENSTRNSSTHNRLAGSIPKGASSPACSVGSTSSFDSMWGYNDQLPSGNATEMLPARSECQENARIQACLSVAAIEASDDSGMQAEQGRSKQKHPAKNNFDPPEDCKMSSVKDVCSTAARVEFKGPPLSSSRANLGHSDAAGSSASGVDEILSAEKTENSTGNSSTHNRLAGSIPKGASSPACSVGSTSSFDSMWGYNDQLPSGNATEMLPARSECQENARIQACLSVAAIEASDDSGMQAEQGRSKQKHPAKNNFDPPEDCKMLSVKDVCSTAARVEFKDPPLSSSRANLGHSDTAGSSASGVDEILSAEKTENSTRNSSTHNRLAGSIPKGASSPACSVGSTSSFDSMWGYNDQLPSGNATEMLPARSECQENARIQACLSVAAIEASDDTGIQEEQGRSKQKHSAKNNFDPPEDCKMSSVKDVCSTAARVEFKEPSLSSSKRNFANSDTAGSSASGVDEIFSAEKTENSTRNSSTHNRLAGSIPKGASSPACSVGSTSSFDSMWGYNDQLPPGNATEMLPARSECQENARIQACLSVAAIEASDDTGMQAEKGRSKQKHPAKNNFEPPEDCKMLSVKDVCSTAARVEFKEPPLPSSRGNFAHGDTAGSSASGVDEILSAEKTENSTRNSSTHNRLAGSIPKGANSPACSVGSTSSFDSMWGYNDQLPSGNATEMLPARSECQENARIQACLSVAAIEASDDSGMQAEQGRSKQKHPAESNFDQSMSSVKDVCSTAARVECLSTSASNRDMSVDRIGLTELLVRKFAGNPKSTAPGRSSDSLLVEGFVPTVTQDVTGAVVGTAGKLTAGLNAQDVENTGPIENVHQSEKSASLSSGFASATSESHNQPPEGSDNSVRPVDNSTDAALETKHAKYEQKHSVTSELGPIFQNIAEKAFADGLRPLVSHAGSDAVGQPQQNQSESNTQQNQSESNTLGMEKRRCIDLSNDSDDLNRPSHPYITTRKRQRPPTRVFLKSSRSREGQSHAAERTLGVDQNFKKSTSSVDSRTSGDEAAKHGPPCEQRQGVSSDGGTTKPACKAQKFAACYSSTAAQNQQSCNFVIIDSDDNDEEDKSPQRRSAPVKKKVQRKPECLSSGPRDFSYNLPEDKAQEIQERLFREAAARMKARALVDRLGRGTAEPTIQHPIPNVEITFPLHWKWKDPYARLGLPSNAPIRTVKVYFRRLARLYHPDKSKAPNTSEKFERIASAYHSIADMDSA